ncbi:CaiB/BaiF CoA transferase family protein [Acuticoccus sediminis]|uniref:CaiB/BaiF CoA transferase family protein n=1 Tax=Acuticoccus sediminis TaxID=2184697 RepID=UPI001CFD541B|nr:CoA transferase [Acuticoccus sediminis]
MNAPKNAPVNVPDTAPLRGTRVVELSTMITAPLAGMMLADMGADVIKVERPDGGDPFRSFRGGAYSPHFCAYNRNKRSVALDLRSDEGRKVLRALLQDADVLLDNFRPGVLDRLGFSDTALTELNPRLVRCNISGFGRSGPYAQRPAYDAVAQAIAGMSSLFVDPEAPALSGPTISDNVTGLYAAYGILAALMERERSGVGRRVDVNMLEATAAFMPDPFHYYGQMGLVSDPYLRVRTSQSYAFRCSDGRLLNVHMSSQEKFWTGFLSAIERPELATDPRFATREGRIENYFALAEAAQTSFSTRTRAEWAARLAEADVPFASVNSVPEALADPQAEHLGTFMELEHPTEGTVRTVRNPVWIDGTRDGQPRTAPPTLGEHTEEILAEIAERTGSGAAA